MRDEFEGVEELDKRNKERFGRLFAEPDHARAILRDAVGQERHQGRVTDILLDTATIDHAFGYFERAHWGSERDPNLPSRDRLALVAVADFVNALVLYERIVTGAEFPQIGYGDPLLNRARGLVHPVDEKLSPPETFALVSLARARAMESVAADPGIIEIARNLLGIPLGEAEVGRQIESITPQASFYSAHHLVRAVHDDEHYYWDFSLGVLGPSELAMNAVDGANAGKFMADAFHLSRRGRPTIPAKNTSEYFAAHLIYRTHVYLLMADLLACPYAGDALRAGLVAHMTGRSTPVRSFGERVNSLLTDAQRAQDQRVNEMLGYPAFSARIPLVFKHVLSRARRPADVLEIALETRDTRAARRFRAYCARVDEAIAGGDRPQVERAFAELSAYGVKLEDGLASGTAAAATATAAADAAKELVTVGSPLLGALVPGLKFSAKQLAKLTRGHKFAFVEQLTRVPRSLNEVEREFTDLWPEL